MWWHLHYFNDNTRYGHSVWAEDRSEAEAIASNLRMSFEPSEVSIGNRYEYRPSKLMILPGGLMRSDLLHATCFISFLAARAGLSISTGGSWGPLDDESPLHSLIHYINGTNNISYSSMLISRILWMETHVPGMPPYHVTMPVSLKDDLAQLREPQQWYEVSVAVVDDLREHAASVYEYKDLKYDLYERVRNKYGRANIARTCARNR